MNAQSTNIALPAYDAIVSGLGAAVTNNGAAKAPWLAMKPSSLPIGDMPERRSAHFKADGLVALRRTAETKQRGHQLRATGLTSSELAILPSMSLFSQAGAFWPVASDLAGLCKGRGDDVIEAEIRGLPLVTTRKYVPTLAAATSYLDDIVRRMLRHDVQEKSDVPFTFSAATLWQKQSKELNGELRQIESGLGGIVKLLETDAAVARHMIADLTVAGGVFVPLDGAKIGRSKTDAFTVNAAWRDALRKSYVMRHGTPEHVASAQ